MYLRRVSGAKLRLAAFFGTGAASIGRHHGAHACGAGLQRSRYALHEIRIFPRFVFSLLQHAACPSHSARQGAENHHTKCNGELFDTWQHQFHTENDFWQFAPDLFGVKLKDNIGLTAMDLKAP